MTAQHPVQLTLDLPFDEAMSEEDFVVSASNQEAFTFITQWPQWPSNVTLLSGPAGSGKTHLAKIWAHRAGAQHHRAKNLHFDTIGPWLETGALVLEDINFDRIDEIALFHLVNTVRDGSQSLLMTAENTNGQTLFSLIDLNSRMRAAVPISIQPPDDVLMRQIIVKQFSDRQINLDPKVVNFLISRMERSLNAVRDVVQVLDQAAFSQNRPITRNLAADVLNL